MNQLSFNVREQVFQVVFVDFLVVHDYLDCVAWGNATHNDTQINSWAVMCLFVGFLLLLLLCLRFSAKGMLMQVLSCVFVQFRRHVQRIVRIVMNL